MHKFRTFSLALPVAIFLLAFAFPIYQSRHIHSASTIVLQPGRGVSLVAEAGKAKILEMPPAFLRNRVQMDQFFSDAGDWMRSRRPGQNLIVVPVVGDLGDEQQIDIKFEFAAWTDAEVDSFAKTLSGEQWARAKAAGLPTHPRFASPQEVRRWIGERAITVDYNQLNDETCRVPELPEVSSCQISGKFALPSLKGDPSGAALLNFSHRFQTTKGSVTLLVVGLAPQALSSRRFAVREVFSSRYGGPASIEGNRARPNLADSNVFFSNPLRTWISTLGLRLPTDSHIEFSVQFPDSETRFSARLGYLTDALFETMKEAKPTVHPFRLDFSVTCGGRLFPILQDDRADQKIENVSAYFSDINFVIPSECHGETGVLSFANRKVANDEDSQVFLSDPELASISSADRPNLLIITADALRNDHTSMAKYARDTTPMLNKLADKGAYFGNYFVQRTLTQTSFPVLFSGKYPYSLYLDYPLGRNGSFYATDVGDNLPKYLHDRGYQVFASVAAQFWGKFGPGLENFDQRFFPDSGDKERLMAAYRWITTREKDRPFFLWVHTLRPHMPYDPDRQFRFETPTVETGLDGFGFNVRTKWIREGRFRNPELVRQVEALYDGGIRQVDSEIVGFLLELDKNGDLDNTLVVISSDHGENMDEHGQYFQHGTLENASLHVPLILYWPNRVPAGVRVPSIVSEVDLYPTILDLLGFQPPDGLDGRSFAGLLKAPDSAEDLEKRSTFSDFMAHIFAVQNRRWKFIENPNDYSFIGVNFLKTYTHEKEELYDLSNDPNERQNVVAEHPDVAKDLRNQLNQYIARFSQHRSDDLQLSAEAAQLLRKAGYLQGGGTSK